MYGYWCGTLWLQFYSPTVVSFFPSCCTADDPDGHTEWDVRPHNAKRNPQNFVFCHSVPPLAQLFIYSPIKIQENTAIHFLNKICKCV